MDKCIYCKNRLVSEERILSDTHSETYLQCVPCDIWYRLEVLFIKGVKQSILSEMPSTKINSSLMNLVNKSDSDIQGILSVYPFQNEIIPEGKGICIGHIECGDAGKTALINSLCSDIKCYRAPCTREGIILIDDPLPLPTKPYSFSISLTDIQSDYFANMQRKMHRLNPIAYIKWLSFNGGYRFPRKTKKQNKKNASPNFRISRRVSEQQRFRKSIRFFRKYDRNIY